METKYFYRTGRNIYYITDTCDELKTCPADEANKASRNIELSKGCKRYQKVEKGESYKFDYYVKNVASLIRYRNNFIKHVNEMKDAWICDGINYHERYTHNGAVICVFKMMTAKAIKDNDINITPVSDWTELSYMESCTI